jgi:cell division protein FtsW (lipid II flippase)
MDLVAGRTFAQERRPIRHVDWFLLVLTLALSGIGLLLLYSATNQTLRQDGLDPLSRVNKQAITIVLGVVVVIVLGSFDYRFLKIYAGFIYLFSIFALVLVRVPGLGATDATGTAQRWFEVAGFQITPSEFTKLALIIMLAAVLSCSCSPTSARRSASPRSSSAC